MNNESTGMATLKMTLATLTLLAAPAFAPCVQGAEPWTLSHDAHAIAFMADVPSGEDIALLLDPEGLGTTVYRLVFSPDGKVKSDVARDDNTNRDRFVFDAGWDSHAKVAVEKSSGTWRLSSEIPFGAFPRVASSAKKWGVKVSGDGKVARPKEYGRREFGQLDRKAYEAEMLDFDFKVRKAEKGLCVCVSVPVRTSGYPRKFAVKSRLETSSGANACDASVEVKTKRPVSVGLSLPCGMESAGSAAKLVMELHSEDGIFLGEACRDIAIEYSPVTIRMTAPYYRDCVFESMKLKRLEGEVVLEEGTGKPLVVELSGPGTKDKVKIASAGATNKFSFAFADKPKGDYAITARGVSKRIRNLPFQQGEVWIDSDRVIHREGEKMFPFGWYSETYGRMYKGVNIAQSYHIYMRDVANVDSFIGEAEANGCGLIISPMQNFMKTPHEKLFGRDAAKKPFDADGLGEERRKALVMFAERAKARKGFFGYYLQDEPEGRDLSPAFFKEAKRILEEVDPHHPTIIVNFTVDGIRRFADSCDILCPDTYPVYIVGGPIVGKFANTYNWCRAASTYGTTSMFSPQAFDWDYKVDKGKVTRGPTYLELRTQSLIALAADVRGLMLYSRYSMNTPSEHLRLGPEFLIREILETKDLFLSPSVPVEVEADPAACEVVAALKKSGGESLLIAANFSRRKVEAVFSSRLLPGALYVGGEKAAVRVSGGKFKDVLGPYEAKVYHSVPRGFSPSAAAAEIEAAEAARRKPGNVALAKRFLTWLELKRMAKGELDNGYPKVSATSMRDFNPKGLPRTYFLQDGFADEVPYLPYHGWSPAEKDAAPALTVDFGERKSVRKVVLTCCRNRAGAYQVESGSVEADGVKLADFKRGAGGVVEVSFPPTDASSLVIRLCGKGEDVRPGSHMKSTPWLSEIEVY